MIRQLSNLRETYVVRESTRRSMRGNRSKNTKAEQTLRKSLFKCGLRGYRKNVTTLPGSPDVVFGRRKVAIFVHGCFWHQCPYCQRNLTPKTNGEFWQTKFEVNKRRDAHNIRELHNMGFVVVTIWECQLKSKLASVVNTVIQCLEAREESIRVMQKGPQALSGQ